MRSYKRKSATVRLVLMGAAVGGSGLLAGCSQDMQRNRYASQTDCVADYSDTQCQADYPINGTTNHGLFYYGPWYRSSYRSTGNDPNDPGPGRYYRGSVGGSAFAAGGHAPAGVEAGTRGGFGSHGRISARGG